MVPGNRRASMVKLRWWLAAWCSLAVIGCASVPSQELSDARRAISAAEKVDADVHAPQLLANAKAALEQARDALARDDYKRARMGAASAHQQAVDARTLAAETQLTVLTINEARQLGRRVAGAEDLLRRAGEAAGANNAARALALLHRARALAR